VSIVGGRQRTTLFMDVGSKKESQESSGKKYGKKGKKGKK